MSLAPIVLFVYNRPWHTRQTIEALLKNDEASESDLIIFSDAPKESSVTPDVELVRAYLKSIKGFKSVRIVEREYNLGLAKSIISGVTEVVNEYGRVIVLEDDLVTSPYFLKYMNDALKLYENDDRVISIHGYNYPIKKPLPEAFFIKGADCWGWATWKRGWELFEADGQKLLNELSEKNLLDRFDLFGAYNYSGMLCDQIAGKNQSWAVRWYASALLQDKLTLYPGKTLVHNIGVDASGTHFSNDDSMEVFGTEVNVFPVNITDVPIREDQNALMKQCDFLRQLNHSGIVKRIKCKLRHMVVH